MGRLACDSEADGLRYLAKSHRAGNRRRSAIVYRRPLTIAHRMKQTRIKIATRITPISMVVLPCPGSLTAAFAAPVIRTVPYARCSIAKGLADPCLVE
jgi:hypothetical protein